MADVYDALDERLARPVAVKVLRPELAANPDLRRRFEAEARAAARLSHPNVVAVYDTGEDAGQAYIVMERLPGPTLSDHIAAGPVDQRWLRGISANVLAALSAAHTSGVVHRDVKPGNILLAADGRAKVADFGIAKSVELAGGPGGIRDADLTGTGMVIGTPAYLAPERVEGRPATPQSDLYALGVVMYEALTGRKPFAGATPLAVAYNIRHERPSHPAVLRPDADPHLAEVIGKAMAPDPADRFASAAAMAAALASVPPPGGWGPAAATTSILGSGPSSGDGRAAPTQVISAVPGPGPATSVLPVVAGALPGLAPAATAGHPGATPRGMLPSAAPPTGRPRNRHRWVAALAGAVVVAAVVGVMVAAGRGHHGTPALTSTTTVAAAGPAAGATTTVTTPLAPAALTPPADPIGTPLRALAAGLTAADGRQAGALRAGLDLIARLPAASQQRADAATVLLAQVTMWHDQGRLRTTTYNQAVDLLQQAGGTLPDTTSTTSKGGDHKGGGGSGASGN